jgi:hypothetical protein
LLLTCFHENSVDAAGFSRQRVGLDLMIVKDGRRLGFEFKYADSPKMTSACRMALEHLKLDQLTLVCHGNATHELADKVRVRGLSRIVSGGTL